MTAAPASPAPGRLLLGLGALSVFLSAGLLFLAEPMVARMLLPAFGGSPAVWTTALVFYQALLLAGYAYAHWGVRRLGLGRQMALHAALLGAALLALPPATRAGPGGAGAWPVPWLVASLALAVGLPFFALAANASLAQRWVAATGRDPYRLYAVSNAGSFLGLVAYPFLVEPALGTGAQARLWSAGFLVFAVLSGLLMGGSWRLARGWGGAGGGDAGDGGDGTAVAGARGLGRPGEPAVAAADGATGARRRLGWLLRAALPSSLLVSTTLAITTDIVAVPLLWVLPLAVYLFTYILAFAWPERLRRSWIAAATVLAISAALVVLILQLVQGLSVPLLLGLALAPLAAGGLLLHLDLARGRPAPERLTEFYLWLALGGVIGGALNSLLAPLIFDTVAEYPLTLAALAWFLPADGPLASLSALRGAFRERRLLALVTILLLLAVAGWRLTAPGQERALWLLLVVLVLPYSLALRPRLAHFAVAASLVGALAASGRGNALPVLAQARSFFGVLQVRQASTGRLLIHGTTLHGAQLDDPALRRVPPTYYHPHGPLGGLVAAQPAGARIGLVGLGTGALAALSKAGQTLDFFEIDAEVETLARRHFSYLADAPATLRVAVVDGRLGLAGKPDGHYDLLVIDAFSSDAVPAHLLTAEALDLYRRKVTPDGLVVLHISNRQLDLGRVLRGWARDTGHAVATQFWEPSEADRKQAATATLAVAIAPDDRRIARLVAESGGAWRPLSPAGPAVTWTDDYSNLVSVLGAPRPQ